METGVFKRVSNGQEIWFVYCDGKYLARAASEDEGYAILAEHDPEVAAALCEAA